MSNEAVNHLVVTICALKGIEGCYSCSESKHINKQYIANY